MDRFSLFEPLYTGLVRGRGRSASLIAWAVDALATDTDTPNLRVLAGLSETSHSAEVQETFGLVLRELGEPQIDAIEEALGRALAAAHMLLRGEIEPAECTELVHRHAVSPLNHPPSLQPWCDLDGGFTTGEGGVVHRLTGAQLEEAVRRQAEELVARDPGELLAALRSEGSGGAHPGTESVRLEPYGTTWPGEFEAERTRLAGVFDPATTRIDHVGSTAVPGLVAKPVIDILVGVPALGVAEAAVPSLRGLGYEYVPEYEAEIPERRYFRKPAVKPRTHHLHCVVLESEPWQEMLRFRDALRADPGLRAEYAELKRRLAAVESRRDYTAKKAPFVRRVLDRGAGGSSSRG